MNSSRFDQKWIYVTIFVIVMLHVLAASTAESRAKEDSSLLSVSLPSFDIGPKETIVAVQVNLKAAVIVHIAQIRSCWDLHILNGDALRSKLDAQALFLSAGIRQRDLAYFEDFITIFKHEPEEFQHTFDIAVTLTITDASWNKIRYIQFKKDQIHVVPKA